MYASKMFNVPLYCRSVVFNIFFCHGYADFCPPKNFRAKPTFYFFKLNKTTILNFYNLQHNRGNSQNTSVPLNNGCKTLL